MWAIITKASREACIIQTHSPDHKDSDHNKCVKKNMDKTPTYPFDVILHACHSKQSIGFEYLTQYYNENASEFRKESLEQADTE